MIIFLILGLILGSLSVIFALQNTDVITVTLFAWQVEGSLALILLLALLTGIIICGLMSIPEVIRNQMRFNALKKELAALKAEKEKIIVTQSDIISPSL